MPTDTAFDTAWLEARFPFDSRARNPKVEMACLQYCNDYSPLHILDIGAGTGSSFLYLNEKLPDQQRWTLVELNPELLNAAHQRIGLWAKQRQYKVHSTPTGLLLNKDGRKIELAFLQQSFLDLSGLLSAEKFHMVTAAAIFDLLSVAMFRQLAKLFTKYGSALLATLNYRSMAFFPQTLTDEHYIKAYEAHMLRPQSFGRSMGPGCCREITRFYKEQHQAIISGESVWDVSVSDQALLKYMLYFMEKSIDEEIPSEESKRSEFKSWLQQKRKQLAEEKLALKVHHCDIFAY